MKNLIQTAEQLLGRKLNAKDGYTLNEIKQAENTLGLAMPEVLRLFYSSVGKVDILTSSFQQFLPLKELQSDGNKIIFLAENQEVCQWATTTRVTRYGFSTIMTRDGWQNQLIYWSLLN